MSNVATQSLPVELIDSLVFITDNLQKMTIVVIVMLIIVCVALYKNTVALNQLRENIQRDDKTPNQQFSVEYADKLFDRGDIDKLSDYCESYLKELPNSVHIHWYYALAKYNLGDYERAREHFENVIRINPLWREGASVYLQEIINKIGHPSSQHLH